MARAPDGRSYFFNTVTKETTWTKPTDLMTPLERALSTQPWKEYTTPEGRKYYSNSETKQTVWDCNVQPDPRSSTVLENRGRVTGVPEKSMVCIAYLFRSKNKH